MFCLSPFYISDAVLIKVDANGTELWNKTFGGQLSYEAISVRETEDRGYIVAGATPFSAWLIKLIPEAQKKIDREKH